MQLFNKSKRTFQISTGALKSEQTITVSEAEGAKLLKMYTDELIQVGNSQTEKENEELKAKIAELEEIVTAPEKAKQNKKLT